MARATDSYPVWRETVLVAAVAALAVGVASVPYVVAYLATPAGLQFGGLLSNPLDGNSYLAKMRLGERGEWLFHLPYSSEEHAGALIYPYYLLLGQVSRLLGWPLILTYHLARGLGGLALLGAGYLLFAQVLVSRPARWAAFTLFSFGSGLGWLAAPLGLLTPDLAMPESTAFHALFASPHFSLGIALLLLALASFSRALVQDRLPLSLLAGIAALLATLVQPFLAVSLYAVSATWVILRSWGPARGIPSRQRSLAHLALLVGVSAPGLALSVAPLYFDPVLSRWTGQNVTLSPPPWDYLLGFGIVAPLALLGLVGLVRKPAANPLVTSYRGLIVAWVVVVVLLLYLPFSLQRRLIEGFQAPLVALGVGGLFWLTSAGARFVRPRLLLALVVAAAVPTNLFLLGVSTVGALQAPPLLYLAEDEREAMQWLGESTPWTAVVLAAPESGNLIPAWAGNRVFYGHPFETVDAAAKLGMVERFYRRQMDAQEQRQFLDRYAISYVYHGRFERAHGFAPLADESILPVVYQRDGVTIYRYQPRVTEAGR